MPFATVPLVILYLLLTLAFLAIVTVHFVVPLAVYFLPWIIALARGHHNTGSIFVFNLLLGWTVIGWLIALVWSATRVRRYVYG